MRILNNFSSTTAFMSLIFSEIKPIIDFGLMMSFGLLTSFVVTFTLLPTLLNLLNYPNYLYIPNRQSSYFTTLNSISSKVEGWSLKSLDMAVV